MKTLRILTSVRIANHGQCIFEDALSEVLSSNLPYYDVRILDYLPRNRYLHELFRAIKPHPGSFTFNLRRFLKSEEFHRNYLKLEKPTKFYPVGYENMVKFLAEKRYDALVVGIVVWDITDSPELPRFPNIYWLSPKIPSKKIAYAVSGHRSKPMLIQKNLRTINNILSSYELIGVRDQMTWEMALESKVDQNVPVVRVPDPAFLFEGQPTQVRDNLASYGVDFNRPILGILFYGKPEFSQSLCKFYHSKGFQTVALSMYNPYVDVNVGHLISSYEWADAFKYLSFCVTDRFHGTIFCLRNNVPFISIEPGTLESINNSKIYSLISDFDLFDCYIDVLQSGFRMSDFFERSEAIRTTWEKNYQLRVSEKLDEMRSRSLDFIQRIKTILA